MSLAWLRTWQPFKIDALGLVTILGAEQVNRSLGCLVSRSVSDYLPLLAAFVVAGDSFAEPIPGFRVYNVSDGIVAEDVSPWFSRWLLTQDLTWNSTCLSLRFAGTGRSKWRTLSASAAGVLVMGTLFTMSLLTRDWWALVNTVALMVSVAVRMFVLDERARGLWRNWTLASDEAWAVHLVKCLVVTPAGQAITLFAQRGLVTETILTEPKIKRKALYRGVRVVGWVAFGCHVVALGMAKLVNQILAVVVLLASTLLLLYSIDTDFSRVADKLILRRYDGDVKTESRSRVYLRLDLTTEEEESLITWWLMPPRQKKDWWTRYKDRVDDGRPFFDEWRKESKTLRVQEAQHPTKADEV